MTSSTNTMMDKTQLGITLPELIIRKIEQMRGDIPKSRYIRKAIENYLSRNSSKNIDYNESDNKAAAKKRRK